MSSPETEGLNELTTQPQGSHGDFVVLVRDSSTADLFIVDADEQNGHHPLVPSSHISTQFCASIIENLNLLIMLGYFLKILGLIEAHERNFSGSSTTHPNG